MLRTIKHIFRAIERIICLVLFFAGLLALFATLYTRYLYGDVLFEHILFNRKGALTAGSDIINKYLAFALLPALIATTLAEYFIKRKRFLLYVAVLAFAFCAYKLKIKEFITNQCVYSDLYKNEYVAPDKEKFIFPKQKRNLIVVYLESMENNYSDAGVSGKNLLPYLTKAKDEAISFDGFSQIHANDYTIAAMVSGHCGLINKTEIFRDAADLQNFLFGAVCYPEILQANGYKTYFMQGSDLEFARTGLFFSNHGFDDVKGRDEIENDFKLNLSENQGTSWGFNDRALYELAKQRLQKIAAMKEPFVFTMITLDTHRPDVYLDKNCKKEFDDIRDVILCADTMINDFINWLKQQDFYENTTLVVISDHPVTGNNPLYPKLKNRQIVNLFFNADATAPSQKRKWTTLDLAPTILEAIGIHSEKHAFGLGRSLFSDVQTLYEKMGNALDIELMKNAKEYEQFNLKKVVFTPKYTPYLAWNTSVSSPQEIADFSAFSEENFNVLYTDNLGFILPSKPNTDLYLKIKFQVLFNKGKNKHFKIFANNQYIAKWDLYYNDTQPYNKVIKIPHDLINGQKLFLKFENQDFGTLAVNIGIGIKEFTITKD